MARLHLKFKNIHATVKAAADEMFNAGPWDGDDEHKHSLFTRFLRRASDAYGVPAPTLEVHTADRALARRGVDYEVGQITLAKYSVINLFHGFRHHLQALGNVVITDSERYSAEEAAEIDAIAWSCSLFYSVRPLAFRRAVRRGIITYVTPDDLLTTASLEARREAELQSFRNRGVMDSLAGDDGDYFDNDSYDDERDFEEEAANEALLHDESEDGFTCHDDHTAVMLDTAGAAAILGVSTSRVLQITDRIGGVRQGRTWTFPKDAVERYRDSR